MATLAAGRIGIPWVFCEDDGTPLSRFRVRQSFERALKAAKLPTIRFHNLGHTSATLLLSAGVHPKVVQERLGHSQISITLGSYSHVMPGLQREAANRLNSVPSANGYSLATKSGSGGSGG